MFFVNSGKHGYGGAAAGCHHIFSDSGPKRRANLSAFLFSGVELLLSGIRAATLPSRVPSAPLFLNWRMDCENENSDQGRAGSKRAGR